MCSRFNFIVILLLLANFATFLDHTKENADVSKNDGYFRLIFTFTESASNLVALPITSQELGRGAFLPPPPDQNRTIK